MDWFWRLLGRGETSALGELRRIIVLVIEGLEPALVDEYLEQGLLHHLTLLSDIGDRRSLVNSAMGADGRSLGDAIGKLGLPAVELRPPDPRQPVDLAAICAADRQQQEQLFAALGRSRPAVVVGVFDMPARLSEFFAPRPDESQRLVLRDIYARMDEIVGKALSFVDARTVLLAVIRAPDTGEVATPSASAGLLFCNRRLAVPSAQNHSLEATIAGLLQPTETDR